MPESFTLKTIQIAITLGKGSFAYGGNTKVIEGLACHVSVKKPGLPEKNSASIEIYGLKYEDMAQLTMLAYRPLESKYNTITIKAGDKGKELSLAFHGEIYSAKPDFNKTPNVLMTFEAETGCYAQQIALPSMTVKGEAPADKLFAQFAKEAGYAYRNEGVTGSVMNAWFSGSPIDKMMKLSKDIGCELIIDDGTIIVLPEGKARSGNAAYLSRDTGLIGYPTFTNNGIEFKCLYNPDLIYGGLAQVESIVPRSSGTWRISKITHDISAYMPEGGNWQTQIEAMFNV